MQVAVSSKKRKTTSARKVVPTRTRALVNRIKRGLRRPSLNCHSFRRWGTVERYDCTGSATNGAMVFSLSDMPGVAEFEALYDRYMLTAVVVRFRIVNNPDTALTINNAGTNIATSVVWNTSNWFPRLFYCPDYDDNNAETLSALRERAKTRMKVLKPNMYFKAVIKPACTVQTYYTTVSAGYAPKWKQWIDMSQSSVPHYGLKWVLDCSGVDPADTQPFKLEIEKQYYFKCKDVR